MKKILMICSIVVVACGMATPQCKSADLTSLDTRILQIKESIETQIERIKNAREKLDTEMSLARIRLAEQLRRSEEDLYRQMAALDRLREQLAEQVTTANSVVSDYQNNLKSIMEKTLADIQVQVLDTNALMAQMEAARNKLEAAPQTSQGCPQTSGSLSSTAWTGQAGSASSEFFPLPDLQFSPQPQVSVPTLPDTAVAPSLDTQPTSPTTIETTTPAPSEPTVPTIPSG